ncbi:reelin-like [Penaeus vannamei]|uniref:Reelin n=1 Tax=Penaeus vannamei TaxID=6689 RepID=A0A3R7QLE3_PENVA|nr:reelin-like [Penaeus vannamei]
MGQTRCYSIQELVKALQWHPDKVCKCFLALALLVSRPPTFPSVALVSTCSGLVDPHPLVFSPMSLGTHISHRESQVSGGGGPARRLRSPREDNTASGGRRCGRPVQIVIFSSRREMTQMGSGTWCPQPSTHFRDTRLIATSPCVGHSVSLTPPRQLISSAFEGELGCGVSVLGGRVLCSGLAWRLGKGNGARQEQGRPTCAEASGGRPTHVLWQTHWARTPYLGGVRLQQQPLLQDVGRTVVQDAGEVVELTSNSIEDDDVTQGKSGSEVAQERSGASFGPVTSPFFFMCQYPRQGEASGVEGQDDLAVKVEFVGSDKPEQGYQPHTVYEVAVSSNVLFDGFMITGIHALTKDISQTAYLHGGASNLSSPLSPPPLTPLPLSPGRRQRGPRLRRRPLAHLSEAPPHPRVPVDGTPARHRMPFLFLSSFNFSFFLFSAQGSIGEQVLFKDLNVLEICEKDASAQLRAPRPGLSGFALPGFVFRDDFEDGQLNEQIWNEIRGGEVRRGQTGQGSTASFFETETSISSVPLDLSLARHLQFTLGGGACEEHAKIQLVFGTALAEAGEYIPVKEVPAPRAVVSAYTSSQDDLSSGSGGGSGGGSPDAVTFDPHADDPLAGLVLGTECASWEEAHSYSPSGSGEVHLQVIPLRFRRPGVCVGWRSAPIGGNTSVCWSLDDVALANHESSSEPISDDFDPVDPSNWFFFPGASVKQISLFSYPTPSHFVPNTLSYVPNPSYFVPNPSYPVPSHFVPTPPPSHPTPSHFVPTPYPSHPTPSHFVPTPPPLTPPRPISYQPPTPFHPPRPISLPTPPFPPLPTPSPLSPPPTRPILHQPPPPSHPTVPLRTPPTSPSITNPPLSLRTKPPPLSHPTPTPSHFAPTHPLSPSITNPLPPLPPLPTPSPLSPPPPSHSAPTNPLFPPLPTPFSSITNPLPPLSPPPGILLVGGQRPGLRGRGRGLLGQHPAPRPLLRAAGGGRRLETGLRGFQPHFPPHSTSFSPSSTLIFTLILPSFSPSSPSFSLITLIFTLISLIFLPQSPSFSPSSPHFYLNHPHFHPLSPSFSPSSPSFSPSAHFLSPSFSPLSPSFFHPYLPHFLPHHLISPLITSFSISLIFSLITLIFSLITSFLPFTLIFHPLSPYFSLITLIFSPSSPFISPLIFLISPSFTPSFLPHHPHFHPYLPHFLPQRLIFTLISLIFSPSPSLSPSHLIFSPITLISPLSPSFFSPRDSFHPYLPHFPARDSFLPPPHRTIGTVALKMQLGECHTSHSQRVSVDVFADHGTFRSLLWHHILSWTMDTYTIPVQKENQLHHTRFCVEQREEVSQDVDVWLLQEVLALSWLPTQPDTDGGRRWTSLHRRCLPGGCMGGHSALTSTITRHAVDSWGLVTLPLPYPALTPHTRLRVRQATGHSKEDTVWALDNVFVGRCLRGCSGRGLCQRDGRCKCEYGYSGPACEDFERENPLYLSEPYPEAERATAAASWVPGQLLSSEVRARALSPPWTSTPPTPTSCSSITWAAPSAIHISLDLPPGARGPGCRFQIWQETHSGAGRDIWAVDDFTITSQLFNNIEVDFSDGAAANSSLRFHLGELGGGLCGRDSALVFKGVSAGVGVSRFMETKSIGVGPSYMMQSPTTRLRLRQDLESDLGEAWAVDDLYIGRQCPGLCSGHGRCTSLGCSCDAAYHGHKCLPLHKLHRHIDASFDGEDDIRDFDLRLVGGNLATPDEGCGNVVAGKNLYFGALGLRQLETDDLNAHDLEILQFVLVVGGGKGGSCSPEEDLNSLSAGSVVVEYSTDGGIAWTLLQELLPEELFRMKLEDEVVKGESGVVRFRIWQPAHYGRNQWAVDSLKIMADVQVSSIQADFARAFCGSEEAAQVMDGEEPVREAVTNTLALQEGDVVSFQVGFGGGEKGGLQGS